MPDMTFDLHMHWHTWVHVPVHTCEHAYTHTLYIHTHAIKMSLVPVHTVGSECEVRQKVPTSRFYFRCVLYDCLVLSAHHVLYVVSGEVRELESL